MLELELGSVETSVAGPKRPQDRIPLSQIGMVFRRTLHDPVAQGGFGLPEAALSRTARVSANGSSAEI